MYTIVIGLDGRYHTCARMQGDATYNDYLTLEEAQRALISFAKSDAGNVIAAKDILVGREVVASKPTVEIVWEKN